MIPQRRARDYNALRHWTEVAIACFAGKGWMANLAEYLRIYPQLQVVGYEFRLATLLPPPPPLQIAFASDFHAGPITHPNQITAAIRQLHQVAPDLLFLGGDFVSLNAAYIDDYASALGEVPAPLGRYAILGNHDCWADDQLICQALQQANIQVLINQSITLPEPYQHVAIIGLDDPTSGAPDPAAIATCTSANRIILMHSPEGLPIIEPFQYQLALCGHTHGGQICLPNGKPLWLPRGEYNRRYPAGHYQFTKEHAECNLIVSRGVGYGGLPIRINAPPEIVVCTLNWYHSDSV